MKEKPLLGFLGLIIMSKQRFDLKVMKHIIKVFLVFMFDFIANARLTFICHHIYNYNNSNQHFCLLTKANGVCCGHFQNMIFQLGSQGFQPPMRTYLITLILNLKYFPFKFINKQNNNL